jgi:hypothetical protein
MEYTDFPVLMLKLAIRRRLETWHLLTFTVTILTVIFVEEDISISR